MHYVFQKWMVQALTIKILADSACDLSTARTKELSIEIVPLSVQLDDKIYQDRINIDPVTVYDAMREGKTVKTSQVALPTFLSVFEESAKRNEPLVYIAFSSGLSGTYQTAKMAEQEIKETYPDAAIHIIDTKCASLGYGLVVLHAAQLAKDGATLETILEEANDYANRMEHIFTVDDLEYLYRGGRVSKTVAFLGTVLKIKPLLDMEDGKLVPREKIRGSKRVLGRMIEVMGERATTLEQQTIGISHGDSLERAEQLAAMIKETFPVKDVIIEMVGAAIGAHSGPGTIALFFLNEQDH